MEEGRQEGQERREEGRPVWLELPSSLTGVWGVSGEQTSWAPRVQGQQEARSQKESKSLGRQEMLSNPSGHQHHERKCLPAGSGPGGDTLLQGKELIWPTVLGAAPEGSTA